MQVVLVWAAAALDDPSLQLCQRLAQALWSQGGSAATPLLVGGRGRAGPQGRGPASGSGSGPAAPARVHSIHVHLQADASDNAIISGAGAWQLLAGDADAWQRFGAASTVVAPGGFVQSNYGAMQRCLQHVAGLVPAGSRIAELFAGSGTIGLHLLQACAAASVRCVELNPACRPAFLQALEQLPAEQASRIQLHTASAGEQPRQWLAGVEVVVVDPPRKGLGSALLDALCGITAADHADCAPLRQLVYISCGWQAFQGDCDALLASGAWELAPQATAFLFFPGTDALETVAVFRRI